MRASKRVTPRSEQSGPPGPPASPAGSSRVPRRTSRPKWWDPRVIGGLVLMIVAVVAGARVIGATSRTTPVWAAVHDLATGTVLTADDLVAVDVNLGTTAPHYLLADSVGTTVGRTLGEAVQAGELMPVSALTASKPGRVIVIGVAADRMPPGVGHGSSIDLYLTTGGGSSGTSGTTALVSSAITVQSVTAPSSGGLSGATSTQYQIAVLLDPGTADRLVRLLPSGEALVVLVAG